MKVLSPDLPDVATDPGQMLQILINLITNAINAMPGGGKLKLKTGAEENLVSLIIEDTGKGIQPEILNRIFDPFFTTGEESDGTGLGLSVVHGIVTEHGGTIHVDSKPGEGTRIKILLPGLANDKK